MMCLLHICCFHVFLTNDNEYQISKCKYFLELGRGWSRASFESIEDANAIKSKMTVAMGERAGYSICVSVLGPEGRCARMVKINLKLKINISPSFNW